PGSLRVHADPGRALPGGPAGTLEHADAGVWAHGRPLRPQWPDDAGNPETAARDAAPSGAGHGRRKFLGDAEPGESKTLPVVVDGDRRRHGAVRSGAVAAGG